MICAVALQLASPTRGRGSRSLAADGGPGSLAWAWKILVQRRPDIPLLFFFQHQQQTEKKIFVFGRRNAMDHPQLDFTKL